MAKPKAGALPNFGDIQAMWQASGLKQKLLFTLAMIIVYRLGARIPLWGIHLNPETAGNLSLPLMSFLDMFSGGALASVSILSLGIGPYITASIIMQLLTVVVPRLEEMQKEGGEQGRKQISKYTRYFAVVLAIFQAILVLRFIGSAPGAIDTTIPPAVFYTQAVLSLTAGAIFALWLAEIITERGVGNGGSLLIFVGILTRIPFYWKNAMLEVGHDTQKSFALVALLVIYLITIGLIIVLQEANRKIFIVSAKRQIGNRVYGGQNTHIPFKINPAGVMPIIFAFAMLAFPSTIFAIIKNTNPTGILFEVVRFYETYLTGGKPLYIVVEFLLIIFFTFFYSSIIPSMQPKEIAENLKKYGSSIPGIKPGRPTADKLEEILSRTTLIGAVALGVITLIASSATSLTGMEALYLGPTSLIIMVGVAMDTMTQIRVHLLARNYEGFLK